MTLAFGLNWPWNRSQINKNKIKAWDFSQFKHQRIHKKYWSLTSTLWRSVSLIKQIVLVQTTDLCEIGPKRSNVLLIDNMIVVIQRKGLKKGVQWCAFLRKEYCDSQILRSDFYLAWAKFSLEVKGNNELKISELCTAVPEKKMLWPNFCFHGDGYTLCRLLGDWTPRIKSSILGCSGPCWTVSAFLNLPSHERVLWAPFLTSA